MSRTTVWALLLFAAMAPDLSAAHVVTVIVHDLASVNRTTIVAAEGIASQVLGQAGIQLRWERGQPEDPQARLVDFSGRSANQTPCGERPSSSAIVVLLVPGAPPGVRAGALGYSLPCARYGVAVTIYADRVFAAAGSTVPASAAVAMGYVLAHEIGHILLRLNGHTSTGIMRAVWTPHDWALSARLLLRFDPNQAAQMQRALSAR